MPWNNDVSSRSTSKRLRGRGTLNSGGIKRDVIVIGASAGGVAALTELFADLPRDIPAAIGVVLHRSTSPSELAEVLGRLPSYPLSNRTITAH